MEVTGARIASYRGMLLAAYRGGPRKRHKSSRPTPAMRSLADGRGLYSPTSQQRSSTTVSATTASLYPGGTGGRGRLRLKRRALPELIEAAVEAESPDLPPTDCGSSATITPVRLGVRLEARSRALLSDGAPAERCYVEAVGGWNPASARPRPPTCSTASGCVARAEGGRAHQLTAHDLFAAMGARAFADRARRNAGLRRSPQAGG
jgi:hypothetical protein